MKILLSITSQLMPTGYVSAKEYPYTKELVDLLLAEGHEIYQIGSSERERLVNNYLCNLPMSEILELLKSCDTFIGIDSFLQHMNDCYLQKKGIVLWGKSDPYIFGYDYNENLYAGTCYFRKLQYNTWYNEKAIPQSFVKPEKIIEVLKEKFRHTL